VARRRAVFLAACAVLLTAARARADVAAPPATEAQGYVQLTVAAADEDAASLAATLRELLGRLGLALRPALPASTTAGQPALLDPAERARVSVDETPADHVDVVVTPLRHGQVAPPVRRTLAKNDSSAILTEQIAHVVHSTLESLLATEGPAWEPPSPPAGPASGGRPVDVDRGPAAASNARGPGVAATVFGTGRGVASGTGPVVGGGAAVGVTPWRGFWRPSFWLSGSYNAPFDEQTTDVAVETTVTSLRGGATFALWAAHGFGLDAGAGVGADVFHTVPGSGSGNPAPRVTLSPTMDLVDPVVTARVLAGVRVAAGARLVVGIDVDYDVASHRYVTAPASGGSSAVASVLEPWPVRPSLLVGLCVPLVGGLGCAE
jgi:hypothetical protein